MALDPASLSQEVLDFLGERHLGTLTTLRADGHDVGRAVGPQGGVGAEVTLSQEVEDLLGERRRIESHGPLATRW